MVTIILSPLETIISTEKHAKKILGLVDSSGCIKIVFILYIIIRDYKTESRKIAFVA